MDCGAYMNEIAEPWRREAWQQHLNEVVVAGRRMHYLDVGAGPVVVLVHGLASAWPVWFRNIPELALGHRVIAVDLPGFGRSDSLRGRVGIRHHVDAIRGLLDHLDVDEVRIVGHSLGAVVAQQFAARHPARSAALVLVASGDAPHRLQASLLCGLALGSMLLSHGPRPAVETALGRAIAAAPIRQRLLGWAVHDPAEVSPELAAEMVNTACGSPGAMSAVTAALRAVRRQDLKLIVCPTLIVGGRCDRIVPVTSLERVAAAITGARCEIIPHAGHHPMFERPDVFNAVLRNFLEELRQADQSEQ